MPADPRHAKTLGEAADNGDGTWNGARALSWLSEVLYPGKSLSEADVRKLWEEAQERRRLTDANPKD
jgi:hypothetical protein